MTDKPINSEEISRCSICKRIITPVLDEDGGWRHVWADGETRDRKALEDAGCYNKAVPEPINSVSPASTKEEK